MKQASPLKVRKESRLRNKFKISSKNQILEGLGEIWFKWVHLIENNELTSDISFPDPDAKLIIMITSLFGSTSSVIN